MVSCSLVSSRATNAGRSRRTASRGRRAFRAIAMHGLVEDQRVRAVPSAPRAARGAPPAAPAESPRSETGSSASPAIDRAAIAAQHPGIAVTAKPALTRAGDQAIAGVADQRRAGIADQRDRFAARPDAPAVRRDRSASLCSCREISGVATPRCSSRWPRVPRVLGRDDAHALQDGARARTDIIEIADRRRDDIEHSRGFHVVGLRVAPCRFVGRHARSRRARHRARCGVACGASDHGLRHCGGCLRTATTARVQRAGRHGDAARAGGHRACRRRLAAAAS